MRIAATDAALTPQPLTARTRMKYVPAATPSALNVVAVLPVSKLARSESPVPDPASMM
jgi:hypothetical protein